MRKYMPFRILDYPLFFLVILLFPGGVLAQDATTLLDKAAAAYQQSSGVSSSFEMETKDKKTGYLEKFQGIIRMKGDKFVLETPDLKTWYNGKTLWTYMDRTEEVNVTTPTGDDLHFTNPAILLSEYKTDFTASLSGEVTQNNKSYYKVELTPRGRNEITDATLWLDKTSALPYRITLMTRSGMKSTILISKVNTGVTLPDKLFEFDPADYPDAEVIDLR